MAGDDTAFPCPVERLGPFLAQVNFYREQGQLARPPNSLAVLKPGESVLFPDVLNVPVVDSMRFEKRGAAT